MTTEETEHDTDDRDQITTVDQDNPVVDLFALDLGELSAHHFRPSTHTDQFSVVVQQSTIPADDSPPFTWPVRCVVTLSVDTGDQPVSDAAREGLAALYGLRIRRALGVAG